MYPRLPDWELYAWCLLALLLFCLLLRGFV